jgi:hypothetical protein
VALLLLVVLLLQLLPRLRPAAYNITSAAISAVRGSSVAEGFLLGELHRC